MSQKIDGRVGKRAGPHPMIVFGTAGEFIACADLIMQGHRAFITAAGLPYDVIADIDGQLKRIAVRSTMQARPRSGRVMTRPCYQFNIIRVGKRRYTTAEADIIALVGLDRRVVAYLPCVSCPSIMHLDEPGIPRVYNHKKGPRRGECKTFSDFPLSAALQGAAR